MYPDLYLMRHGQTEWNAEGRMQGRLDSPLTSMGITQSKRQAELIAKVEGNCFASTLGRAIQAARIVFGDKEFTTDDRLVEIDIGEFSGHKIEELLRDRPEFFTGSRLDWYDRAPGGEHFSGLAVRAHSFLDDLTGPAIIVTHGMFLRMLRITALGWPVSRIEELSVEQGSVHVIRNGKHEIWH